MLSFISSLPFIFILALLISSFFYLIGSKVTPKARKPKKKSSKLEPYACGETMPARKFRMDIERFFLYVTIFMIFDISAFILALSFSVGAFYPLLFSTVVASSLLTVIHVVGGKRK